MPVGVIDVHDEDVDEVVGHDERGRRHLHGRLGKEARRGAGDGRPGDGDARTLLDERRYLAGVDPLYYSAGYPRAWFLEAQLNAVLSARYGVKWFENPEAGRFLLQAWARGDKLDGEEFAALIGEGTIRPEALLEELRSMVRFSAR